MAIPVKSISELEEKSEVSVNDKILILDSVSEEARLARKDELKGDPWTPWQDWEDGADWQPWYTPVKWVDYFTQADIESLNIPTKVSDLSNDENFSSMDIVTEEEWEDIEDRMTDNVNYFIYE